MLFLLLLLAVILVGLTVRLALSAVTGSSRTNQNLARIEEYGFGSVEAPQEPEITLREHLNSLATLTGRCASPVWLRLGSRRSSPSS